MILKKIRSRTAVITALNILSLILSISFFISAHILSSSQKTQFSAEKWTAYKSSMSHSQLSAFFSSDAEFTTDSLEMIRSIISEEISNASIKPKDNSRCWYDSYYSRIGKLSAKGTVLGNKECEINAVNGDFFMLHNFKLIDGAFFADNDITQDYAVIDDNTAWLLFGSSDVAGMSLTVNDIDFYVSGVIERPKSKSEIKNYGDTPRIYISYDGATAVTGDKYSDISCYEAILPEPVKDFSYKAFKKALDSYIENTVIVKNTNRFSFDKRLKAIKNISSCVAAKKPVIYPWWENAARTAEFKLSFIYLAAVLSLIIPILTLVILFIKLFKLYKKYKQIMLNKLSDLIDKIKTRKYRKEHLHSDNTNNNNT